MTPKEIVETVCDAYQRGDLKLVNEYLADNIRYHNNACLDAAPYSARADNRNGFNDYINTIVAEWNIEKFQLQHIVVDGSQIATRTDFVYVNKETGKRVTTEGAHFWTVKDGKIAEIFEFYDTAAIAAAM